MGAHFPSCKVASLTSSCEIKSESRDRVPGTTLGSCSEDARLTRHNEVDHGAVVPGEALGPAQLGLWGPEAQDVPPAVMWAPNQALQVPGLGLFPTSCIDALPALCGHELGEPHQALALLQQLKLQEVAAPTEMVLPFLHIQDALQLVLPGRQGGGSSHSLPHMGQHVGWRLARPAVRRPWSRPSFAVG